MRTEQVLRGRPKLIVYLIGQDSIAIINDQGICLASSDQGLIGNVVKLPQNLCYTPMKGDAVLAHSKEDSDTITMSPFLKNFAELVLKQYLESQEISQGSMDQLLIKILNSQLSENSINIFDSEAKSLGLNLNLRRVGILLHFKNFEESVGISEKINGESDELIQKVKKDIINSIEGFFTQGSKTSLVIYLGTGKFIVYKTLLNDGDEYSFQKNMRKAYQAIFGPLKNQSYGQLTVGFGNSHTGVKGLVDAYKEAKLASDLGYKVSSRQETSYYFGDLREIRIIAEEDNEKKVQYAKEIIGRLKNPELKRTLETFFEENLNLTDTAMRLKIHPNTVTYRLNKIKDILDLDPRTFSQANSIKIALLATELL